MNKNITVIGIGKLGLGFALLLEEAGYNVVGVDINVDYVNKLNSRDIQFSEPGYNELLRDSKNFRATSSLDEGIAHSDMIFILVQTPNSGGHKFYDHSILSNVLVKINKIKPENKDIVIGCTVMPGYIDTVATGLISDCKNCYLSYNPEFVAQGDIVNGFRKPDIILVGSSNTNIDKQMREIYINMTDKPPKFCFMTNLEAEIVKISLNGFITTKISFANMISDLCDTLGASKSAVLEAIGSDSRIGTKYFRPGYSFGGPCFPRDTKALKQLMDQNKIHSGLLQATTEYNEEHVRFQTQQLLRENKHEYHISNVCYKDNSVIPMIEESAKLKIAKSLVDHGKTVVIHDTEELIMEVKKEYGNIFQYQVIDI